MSTQPHDSTACPKVGRLICEVTNEGKTTASSSCRANCTDKPTGPSIKDQYFKLVGTGVSPPPNVTTISHVTTGSPRLCGVECLKVSVCGSFLLNPGSSQCLLYAGNHSSTVVQGPIGVKYFVKYKNTV
ncbi:hypothetical protein MAR_012020 [Mya arenaria]|uniref:Apple domain-containing protein n=1 Tax=Mya arenaria TaxID=6604 RepID=A0ABY7FZY2_MYAAR|nr:hypothetical protein MAR_012020 [Mya arenaria]